MLYVETTTDVTLRGNLVSVGELRSQTLNPLTEYYRSVYMYDEDMMAHFKETKSVSRFKGKLYPEFIPIDLDYDKIKDRPMQHLVGLIDFLKETLNLSDEEFNVYFSGRGFHVLLSASLFGFTNSEYIPTVVKQTMAGLFSEFPYDSQIYDATRLFRMDGSYNKKSGLYKIRLEPHEFYHIAKYEEIQELAKSPRVTKGHVEFEQFFDAKLAQYVVTPRPHLTAIGTEPKKYHCIVAMLSEPPVEGDRHAYMLRIVSHFRRHHYPAHLVRAMVVEWLGDDYGEMPGQVSSDELDQIVNDLYSKHYTYSCSDHIMASKCNPTCALYQEIKVYDSLEMARETYKFATTDHQTINLRWLKEDYVAYPGSVIQLVSGTNSGKSAFTQNWVKHMKDIPVLYMSFEMPAEQIYRRQIQIEYGIDKYAALERMKKDERLMTHIYPKLMLIQKKIGMDDLERVIDSLGIEPFVIIVDHLLLMKSERWSEYDKIAELTSAYKDFAMTHKKIFISISQVSRQANRQEALDIHSGKGNSSIESDSDTVILLQRPDRQSVYANIEIAKDREGQFFRRFLGFNGSTLQFQVDNVRVPENVQMKLGIFDDEVLESIRKKDSEIVRHRTNATQRKEF